MIKATYNDKKSGNKSIVFDLSENWEFKTKEYCDSISIAFDANENMFLYTGFSYAHSPYIFHSGFISEHGARITTYPVKPITRWNNDTDLIDNLLKLGISINNNVVAKLRRQVGKKDHAYRGSELFSICKKDDKNYHTNILCLKSKDAKKAILLYVSPESTDPNTNLKKEWDKNFIVKTETKTIVKHFQNVCFYKFGIFSIERS